MVTVSKPDKPKPITNPEVRATELVNQFRDKVITFEELSRENNRIHGDIDDIHPQRNTIISRILSFFRGRL